MGNADLTVLREVVEPCRVKLTIDVSAEEVGRVFARNLAEFRKQGKVPGFRPGKTPKDLVLRHYGPKVREETRRELIRENTEKAVKQENLRAETGPRVENPEALVFNEDAPFHFAVSLDVAPEFALPNHRDLNVTRKVTVVDDALVEQTIQEWLQRRVSYQKVERPAQAEDMLKVAWHGDLADVGTALPEHVRFLLDNPDGWLPVKTPEIIPGAIAAVIGLKAGDEAKFDAVFPADYFEKALTGKSATFRVRIIEVQAPQLPELNDKLAQDMGHKNLETLRTFVRGHLNRQEERRQHDVMGEQILAALLRVPEFPLPPAVLSRATIDEFVRLYNQELRGGKKEADIQAAQDKLMEQARALAAQNLRRHYVVGAVADAEKISVSQEELAHAIASLAEAQRVTPKALYHQLEENGRLGALHDQIREAKTIDCLLKSCKIDGQPQPAAPAAEPAKA